MTTTVGLTYALGRALYVSLTNRCNALTLVESRGPGFAISAASGFAPLQTEPTPDHVFDAVAAAMSSNEFSELCFAGAGEPLLRLTCLEASSRLIREVYPASQLPIRINTNGLVPGSEANGVASRLKAAGVDAASVAIATADAEQYQTLMHPQPLRYSPVFSYKLGHADVCTFIKECIAVGITVEATCVERPGVDVEAARQAAIDLGASFRSRSWHS